MKVGIGILLLFFVGMDIGNNNEVFNQLRNMSKKIQLRVDFAKKI